MDTNFLRKGGITLATLFTYGGLRDYFKDMYLVVSVAERDERGFASKYRVIKSATNKRDIEILFEEAKEKYPDCYVHETFRDSRRCTRFKTIDGELKKISAFSSKEVARQFREYYGT